MRFLRWRLVLVGVMLVGASCGGPDFPDEDDVPQEALVVMPGAVVVESLFAEGDRRTDIDGRHHDSSSIQTVAFEVDGVTGRDVYEFYLAELSDKGWDFYDANAGALGPPGIEPGQCRTGGGDNCGSFEFRGPDNSDDGIGVIHTMFLILLEGTLGSGDPVGIEHIDDEIDSYEIKILVGFAPSESCVDWEGPAWGVCAG